MTETEKRARMKALSLMKDTIDELLVEDMDGEEKAGKAPVAKPKAPEPEPADEHEYDDEGEPCEECGEDPCDCEKPKGKLSLSELMRMKSKE